jgi:hypothetical protein
MHEGENILLAISDIVSVVMRHYVNSINLTYFFEKLGEV